eukprot:scaffold22164_cov68-Phaeocystis_antarctica.AAC.8
MQLHQRGAGAHREQGGECAAREECVVGCGDPDSAERETRVEHQTAQEMLAGGQLNFKLLALEFLRTFCYGVIDRQKRL